MPDPRSLASAKPLPPKQGRGGVRGPGWDTRKVLAGASGGAAATPSSHLVKRVKESTIYAALFSTSGCEWSEVVPTLPELTFLHREHARQQADEL